MKLKMRDLKEAISALEYKAGWDSNSKFNESDVEITAVEEDIDGGILCGAIRVSVNFSEEDREKRVKHITKTIELYPQDENRKPIITRTETYELGKD